MRTLKERNCWWAIGMISLSNGIFLIIVSGILFNQTVFLWNQQKNQTEAFVHVQKQPFKQSNWMKSAFPLVIASALGVFVGGLQTGASIFSLVMENSKSIHVRKMGWLIWIASSMFAFTLSCLSFALAVMLKAHVYRDPSDSVNFWENYRSNEVTHNFEGHTFCSAIAWNCLFLLTSIAIIAGKVFGHQERPHLLLGM